ncbi:MAG: GTP-binding protein [Candidatus Helarchaeota archaeon]
MPTVAEKLDTLLKNYITRVPSIIAVAVYDHDGLPMSSSMKEENDEMAVAACSAMLNDASQRINKEFSEGTQHLGAVIETENGKFIFTLCGKSAVLTTLTDVDADTDKVQPWTYIVAEKIQQIIDLGNEDVLLDLPSMSEPQKFHFKMVILGDGAVGKTSLIRRFIEKTFKEDYKSTIGVGILTKQYQLSDAVSVTLNLWDLAGQKMFLKVRQKYLGGAQCGCLVYDVTRRDTFENIDSWVSEIEDIRKSTKNFALILVGNKIDLPNRVVTIEEGKAKAEALNIPYIETSAKSGENVDKTFGSLCYLLIKDSVK